MERFEQFSLKHSEELYIMYWYCFTFKKNQYFATCKLFVFHIILKYMAKETSKQLRSETMDNKIIEDNKNNLPV